MSKLRSSTLRCASWMLLRDPRVHDGLVVGHAHALHERLDPVAREDAHQIVFERQVEPARARIALAARAAAELVVDAARLVPLGAEDVQPAELAHLFALGLARRRRASSTTSAKASGSLSGSRPLLAELELRDHLGVAAEHDVGAAAGHVRADRDGALAPGLRDDECLALVVLRVQDRVRDLLLLEQVRDGGALLDARRADEHRLALLVALENLGDDGGELLALGLVDDVLVIGADHRLVGGRWRRRRACRSRGTRSPRCRRCRSCPRASCRGGRGSGR